MGSRNRRLRRGMTLTEVAVAAALLVALVPTVAKLSASLTARQRAADRRVVAMQAVEAALENVLAQDWELSAPDRIEPPGVPAALAPHLPGARVTAESQDSPFGRRVTVGLTWRDPRGQRAGPLRLSAWVFPEEEAEL